MPGSSGIFFILKYIFYKKSLANHIVIKFSRILFFYYIYKSLIKKKIAKTEYLKKND
jgi:hypothetical protein